MKIITKWARENKKPISHREIIKQMKILGVADYSTINGIRSLIKKEYIRRAVVISNKSYYVLLRSV